MLIPIAVAIYLVIPLLIFYKIVMTIRVSDIHRVILLLVLIASFSIVTYLLFQYIEYQVNINMGHAGATVPVETHAIYELKHWLVL